MTEATRIWIIYLIAAILVATVDAGAVEAAALTARSVGSVSFVWSSRDDSSLRMRPSFLLDLSSRASAHSMDVV